MQLHLFPIYQLLWLFFIYAFLGWCTEVAYAALDTGKLVNRGFLNGPLCPIYGCGMAAVLTLLLPLQDNLLILFAGGMLLTTLIELVGGWALKTLFHTTWWDYSDKPFNLGGYICLEFSILWGIGATIMVRVVHPVVMKLVLAIPHKIGLAMLGSMTALFVVDLLATLRVVAGLERDLSELDRIAEALRKGSDRLTEKVGGAALQADEKLDESKETLEAGKLALEIQVDTAKDELLQRQAELQARYDMLRAELTDTRLFSTRGARRLLRAFPRMENLRHTGRLSELREKKPVWVELGLQTIHETTARAIRRGYPLSVYDDAVRKLKARNIEVVTHQILGLPGETQEMMVETARYIGRSGSDGIKLHLLHVLSGTDLAADYAAGQFEMLSLDAYITALEACLRVLPREMVIHRMTGDGAKRELLAPLWSADKKRVLNEINRRFLSDDLEQGSDFIA